MAYILFILISIIWGSSFILMKKASLVFGPVSVAALRAIGGAVVLAIALKLVKNDWRFDRRIFLPIAFISITANILPYSVLPHLISQYGSSFIGMMIGLVPFMTVLFSIPMLKEWPTKLQIAGIISGLICLVIIFSDGLQRSIPAGSLFLAIIVPAIYSFSNTFIKKKLSHLSPLFLSCCLLSTTSLVLLPIAVVVERVDLNQDLALAISSVTILGIFCTGIATYMFVWLIRERGPLFAGMVAYVIPVVALIWGWIDSEPISSLQLIAVAGIVSSVMMVQNSKT